MKQAVILAAGKGIRMLPLTKYVPKPLVEINGKPFLYYVLKNLEKAGYERVYIVVGHKKDKVEEFFSKNSFNFEIKFIHQLKRLGTGHAVKLLDAHIKKSFVVLMGDNYYSFNDLNNINFEDDYSYVYALKHETPEKFGVLVTKGDLLVEIEEKPENPKTNLINAALYKFTPEVFDILKKIKKSSRGEYELTSAIDVLSKKNKVKVKELESWVDLGKFDDIPKVEAFMKKNF
ncbi:NTP transferase domain-containing protein [Candidatus Woesearchaeota archaeon]|nr:NTP transferase domain-containing protein [Candidatus Woesearchaeota archaeon]